MKREPSAFSYVKNLIPGEAVTIPGEKLYAARCACSYLEAEYEQTFSVVQDGDEVKITRLT